MEQELQHYQFYLVKNLTIQDPLEPDSPIEGNIVSHSDNISEVEQKVPVDAPQEQREWAHDDPQMNFLRVGESVYHIIFVVPPDSEAVKQYLLEQCIPQGKKMGYNHLIDLWG